MNSQKNSHIIIVFIAAIVANTCLAQNANGVIDLNNLDDYINYFVPDPVLNSNTIIPSVQLNNEKITLGRVLFYDKNLSVNNTVSCASCHKQAFAFGDTAIVSPGWNGEFTKRHTPKLINLNYAETRTVFWDNRTNRLEQLAIETISNPVEMGFSGTNGQPDANALYAKLAATDYYPALFEFAFGDTAINQLRVNVALAQFVRSIVSFDTKYDEGLQAAGSPTVDFPNFTEAENRGRKMVSSDILDLENEELKCALCHVVPSFQTIFILGNNGIIGVPGEPNSIDLFGSKPPALREMVNPNGTMNGPLMHDGSIPDLRAMINHYDSIPNDPRNSMLHPFLSDISQVGFQVLNLEEDQKLAIEAFFKTLTGNDVYTNPKWSDPFNEDGSITLIPRCDNSEEVSIIGLPPAVSSQDPVNLYGNPAGGTFSGPGVAFNIFNPALVLPGLYEIKYTYSNNEGCSVEVSENILVAEISFNFVNYNLGTINPKIRLDFEVFEDSHQPISVTNLNGQTLYNSTNWFEKGNQQLAINTNNWQKGIYFVKVGQQTKPAKVYVY